MVSLSMNLQREHDDSFPVALDKNFQRISAVEALLWKRRDVDVEFYCPKCYQIDPNQKTAVRPSSSKHPQFQRKRRASHLESCQYRHAEKYMEYLTKRFQIPLKEKELHVALPPYEVGSIMEESLQTRHSLFEPTFMQLMEKLLLDYDLDLFFKRYGQVKIFNGNETITFIELFQNMEQKKQSLPKEDRLQVMIGTVYDVEWSDQYLYAVLDNLQAEYSFSLYFHPYHYSKSMLDLLKNRKVACLGYVQKVAETEYRMEIISIDAQIAFIDDLRPLVSLAPSIKGDVLIDHLLSHAQPFTSVKVRSFKRSYYARQLRQFEEQQQEEEKRARLLELEEKIPALNERMLELKVAKEQLEKSHQDDQKQRPTFWPQLKRWLFFWRSSVKSINEKSKRYIQELEDKMNQTRQEFRQIKAERTELKEALAKIEKERNHLIQKQKEEKKTKKGIQGYLFEAFFGEKHGVVVNLCPKADRFNVEVEVNLFEVTKMENYYLPQSKINRSFATDGATGEREIQILIKHIWKYIDQQIQEISSKQSVDIAQ